MKKVQVTEHRIDEFEHDELQVIAEMVVHVHMVRLSETQEKEAHKNGVFTDKKLHGIMGNERVFSSGLVTKMVLQITGIKNEVHKKRIQMRKAVEDAPEYSSGTIILRPRAFAELLVENYTNQIKMLDRAIQILTEETEGEE
jgi:hypothetical protein